MSSSQKTIRAAQARRRRAKLKEHLQILGQQACAPGATNSMVNEYNAALEKRTNLLQYDKDRAAIRRKYLKKGIADGKTSALKKLKRIKEAKRTSYLKKKKNGQAKAYKAKRRAQIKIQFIKDGLEEKKGINNY